MKIGITKKLHHGKSLRRPKLVKSYRDLYHLQKLWVFCPVLFSYVRRYMRKKLNEKAPMEAICRVGQSWLVFGAGQKWLWSNLTQHRLRSHRTYMYVEVKIEKKSYHRKSVTFFFFLYGKKLVRYGFYFY